ncbi:MAG TPA: hypothetical protein VK081_11080 [Planctomycetota bacterium]|nr:hypothetical protein [Planctomycetota bacterium]
MKVRTWGALRGAVCSTSARTWLLVAGALAGAAGFAPEAAAPIPPVIIGGWTIRAGECAYQEDEKFYTLHVARELDLPPISGYVEVLWAAVLIEGGQGVTLLDLQPFEPAELPLGSDTEVEMTGTCELGNGEVLRLRVFDHEPQTSELTSGALLWST